MDLEPGVIVEKYTVESLLGRGGMASVYRVHHNALGTVHALKVLTIADRTIRDRLLNEGRLQARLRHPNIVPVTDVLDVNGAPGLLMECVEGDPLDVWLAQNRPTLAQAERIFGGILAGVERAHALGVTHRDLKPDNVLLDMTGEEPVPKVADFGIAKALDTEGGVYRTRQGLPMGTPAYMAPEQFRNAAMVDHRADIYSLACILYELVCGRVAFAGADFAEIFAAAMAGRYPDPRELNPDLPDRVVAAITGGLRVDRDARIPSCASLRDVLTGRAPTRPPAATPIATATLSSWDAEVASVAPALPEPAIRAATTPQKATTPPEATRHRSPVPPSASTALPTLSPTDLTAEVEPISEPPEAQDTLPEAQDTLPEAQDTLPEAQDTLPEAPSGAGRWKTIGIAAAMLLGVVGVGLVGWPKAPAPSAPAPVEAAPVEPAPADAVPGAAAPGAAAPGAAAPVVAAPVQATAPPGSAPVAPVVAALVSPPPVPTTVTTPSGTTITASASDRHPPAEPGGTVPAAALRPTGAPPPARATVTFDGATALWLEADGSRQAAGAVSAGSYTILASFNGAPAVAAGTVRLHGGDVVHIRCDADFMQCRP